MTDHEMTCEMYETLLPAELEGELTAEEQSRVERHPTACRRCWALREDLLEITRKSQALPPLAPSRDLWAGVAARIEAPVIALGTTAERPIWRRRSTARLGAAAAAIAAISAAATYSVTRAMYESRPAVVATAAPPAVVESVPDPGYPFPEPFMAQTMLVSNQTGDAAYDREVAQLKAIFERRRPHLDTATVAVLERNLQIIDKAIADSRAALARDPGSALLNRQLGNALGKKVQVLRSAARLPAAAE